MGLFGFAALLFIVFIGLLICLIPEIFFILTMQRALKRCALENQTMTPASTWLSLIPVFNLVWNFILVTQMAASLEREFKRRNIPVEPAPGKSIGLAWCILVLGCLIPVLGILSFIGALVCWVLYWVKIAGFSATLAVHTMGMQPVPV